MIGCGLSIHGKCLSHAPQLCFSSGGNSLELTSPLSDTDTPKVMSMFGNDLGAQAAQEGRSVPLIVQKCIEAVEARGMDYEGIYRKSGGAAQMRAIQVAFDQGEDVDLVDEDEYNDICSVTSVLKQYFRELPNPPLTFELYTNFIDAVCKYTCHDANFSMMSLIAYFFFKHWQQDPRKQINSLSFYHNCPRQTMIPLKCLLSIFNGMFTAPFHGSLS